MSSFLFKHQLSKPLLVYFLIITVWWFSIFVSGSKEGTQHYLYNLSYIIFNLVGGIGGLYIARDTWGGLSSTVGRGITFLSLGLLGAGFGLLSWTIYNLVLRVEVPYPSVADIGYFSIIPFYGYAMLQFAHASGVKITLKSVSGKMQAILIPLAMVALAYAIFLRNIPVDLSQPLRTFLDFGYPGLEPIAVSFGILTYSLSRGVLGGRMKKRILFVIGCLIIQYLTDYSFLYAAGLEKYYNAGPVDLLYSLSYLVMALGVLSFSQTD